MPHPISRRAALAGASTIAFTLLSRAAVGAADGAWPARTIRLIVPFASTADIHARIVAERLSERLGHKIIIDSKPGGAGIIGMQIGAHAPADGYAFTFVIASYISTYPFMYRNLPYDVERDFTPVAMLSKAGFLFIVREGLGVTSLSELTAYIRAHPRKLSVVNLAPGSFAHLSFESYLRSIGGGAEMVPYRTEPQAVQDLWGGRVDLHLCPIAVAPQVLMPGKARAVAITTAERHPLFPDVPSLEEQGIQGFDFFGWYGVFAPKNTPPAIVDRMNRELIAISADPAYRQRMIELGALPGPLLSPDQFRRAYQAEQKRFGPLIKSMGIVIE